MMAATIARPVEETGRRAKLMRERQAQWFRFVNRDFAACRGEPRAIVPGHSYNSPDGGFDVRASTHPTDTGLLREPTPHPGLQRVKRVANAELSADLAG